MVSRRSLLVIFLLTSYRQANAFPSKYKPDLQLRNVDFDFGELELRAPRKPSLDLKDVDFDFSGLELRPIKKPALNLKDVDFNFRSLDLKKPQFDLQPVRLPQLPKFKVPQIKVPQLKVPQFRLPNIKLPKLDLNFDKFPRLKKFRDTMRGYGRSDEVHDVSYGKPEVHDVSYGKPEVGISEYYEAPVYHSSNSYEIPHINHYVKRDHLDPKPQKSSYTPSDNFEHRPLPIKANPPVYKQHNKPVKTSFGTNVSNTGKLISRH